MSIAVYLKLFDSVIKLFRGFVTTLVLHKDDRGRPVDENGKHGNCKLLLAKRQSLGAKRLAVESLGHHRCKLRMFFD